MSLPSTPSHGSGPWDTQDELNTLTTISRGLRLDEITHQEPGEGSAVRSRRFDAGAQYEPHPGRFPLAGYESFAPGLSERSPFHQESGYVAVNKTPIALPGSFSPSLHDAFDSGRLGPQDDPSQSGRAQRRYKAHVPSACLNCKRAHLKCESTRPCPRCCAMGKQDSCIDVQHKKRGRPRLRDERDRSTEGALQNVQQQPAGPLLLPQEHLATNSPPLPKFQADVERGPNPPFQDRKSISYSQRPAEAPSDIRATVIATALLSLDLVIASYSQPFRDAIAPGTDLRGMNLIDLVAEYDRPRLQQLRRELREERDAREPTYLAPIYGSNELATIGSIPIQEALGTTTAYHERIESFAFHSTTSSSPRRLQVRICLAKTIPFFAVVSLFLPQPDPRLPPPSPFSTPSQYQMSPRDLALADDSPGLRRLSTASSASATQYYTHSNSSPALAQLSSYPRQPPDFSRRVSASQRGFTSTPLPAKSTTISGSPPFLDTRGSSSTSTELYNTQAQGLGIRDDIELKGLRLPPLRAMESFTHTSDEGSEFSRVPRQESSGGQSSARPASPVRRKRLRIEEMIE